MQCSHSGCPNAAAWVGTGENGAQVYLCEQHFEFKPVPSLKVVEEVVHHGLPKPLFGKKPDLSNVELEALCGLEGGLLTLGWESVTCKACGAKRGM